MLILSSIASRLLRASHRTSARHGRRPLHRRQRLEERVERWAAFERIVSRGYEHIDLIRWELECGIDAVEPAGTLLAEVLEGKTTDEKLNVFAVPGRRRTVAAEIGFG